MTDRRRHDDFTQLPHWLYRVLVISAICGIASIFVTGLNSAGLLDTHAQTQSNKQLLERIVRVQEAGNREGRERRDQTCRVFESGHLKDVQQLAGTYNYLIQAKRRGEIDTTLNQFVVASLPKAEQEARIDSAPDYCDEPGAKAEARGAAPIGLPEPDPVIPCRPRSLADLPGARAVRICR